MQLIGDVKMRYQWQACWHTNKCLERCCSVEVKKKGSPAEEEFAARAVVHIYQRHDADRKERHDEAVQTRLHTQSAMFGTGMIAKKSAALALWPNHAACHAQVCR